jgi:hypothetical protein
MRIVLCAAMLALATSAAGAVEATSSASANAMLPNCKALINATQSNTRAAGYCEGMIVMFAFMSPFLDSYSYAGCTEFPNNVTVQQVARVIVRYIEARPQRIHESFMALVIEALHEAWPCSDFEKRFRGR